MKSQDKFNELKERYKIAYKICNNNDIKDLYYKRGWVYLKTTPNYETKIRVRKFEEMTNILESRRSYTGKKMKELLEILLKLHAFNKLTDVKVEELSEEFKIDTKIICSEYGITYNIVKKWKQ